MTKEQAFEIVIKSLDWPPSDRRMALGVVKRAYKLIGEDDWKVREGVPKEEASG